MKVVGMNYSVKANGKVTTLYVEQDFEPFYKDEDGTKGFVCKLRSNGMPVPLLRNGYSIFNGTKYR